MKAFAIDPSYKRILPILKCPYCNEELSELKIKLSPFIRALGWICSCDKFKDAEKVAFYERSNKP